MAKKLETSNGKKGGLLKGKTHDNGGIKAVVVTDNDRPVELENNEVIITAPAVKKHWKTLDKINRDGGGVPIGPPQMKKGGPVKLVLPQQGTVFTKDKQNKLDYVKLGADYEFVVFEGQPQPMEDYTRTQYKRKDKNKVVMNYSQFIDYLYSENYINDKMDSGGILEKALYHAERLADKVENNPKLKAYSDKMEEKYKDKFSFLYEEPRHFDESPRFYKTGGPVNKKNEPMKTENTIPENDLSSYKTELYSSAQLSPRAENALIQSLDEYNKADTKEKERLKNIVIGQMERNEKGKSIGFELDKDLVAAGKEFLKRTSDKMLPSDIISVALQDVISLERYRNLDLAEAKVLFKIKEKALNDDDSWVFGEPTTQREAIYTSLYDMNYITLGGENNEYELSHDGKDFIKAVKARIETIKGVQEGTDLFPEEANIDLYKPERIYVDLKSCLVEEGDEESTFIFEGKEFINKESGHNERWKIVSFYKYGVNLEHVTMNKLTTKKKNEKLSFEEMKKLEKEGLIEILGINSVTQINHCLKILTKCIDNIDLKESHEAEKTAHKKTKIDNIKISTPAPIIGVTSLKKGDEGMWRGGEYRIVGGDELGNAFVQEIGVDKPSIKVSLQQLEREFRLFPEESPYELTEAISTLEMLLEADPSNKEWEKELSYLKGETVKMEDGGEITGETDKDIFESQFGKQ